MIKKMVVQSPTDLEPGDIILGARVNYLKWENDDDGWTTWNRETVEDSNRMDRGKTSLIRSHHMCQFLIERSRDPNAEPVYEYVKGQGWVPC